MRELSLDEIKKIELEILEDFVSFCDKNGLVYSLAYGTLLGAIRHRGFIPWDDDIDLWMPRPDYDFFIKYYKSQRYSLLCLERCEYYLLYAKLTDSRTFATGSRHEGMGAFIDIFPVEGLPGMERRSFAFIRRLRLYGRFYSRMRSVNLWQQKVPGWYYYKFWGIFCSTKRIMFLVDRLRQKYSFASSTYSCSLPCSVPVLIRSKDFSNMNKLEFEGHYYYAICNYDHYLTILFGDYMTPPPIEKRVSAHKYSIYIIE